MPLVDSSCLLGLDPQQRWYQLYLAAGGIDNDCFLGYDRRTQQEMFLELVGADTCFDTEEGFWRNWVASFGETCIEGGLQNLQLLVYTALYDAAGDDTLLPPECFLGVGPDGQIVAIFNALIGGIGEGDLVRLVDGEIGILTFDSLDGYTNEGGWSSVERPLVFSAGAFPLPFYTPGLTFDLEGVREPTPKYLNGTLYLAYDGGDGVTGWQSFLSPSTDFGQTWGEAVGFISYIKVGGGAWAAVAMGWLGEKDGLVTISRVTAPSTFAPPNTGLPSGIYGGDVWTVLVDDLLTGPYNAIRNYIPEPGTWVENYKIPGSNIVRESDCVFLIQGFRDSKFRIGTAYGATPQSEPVSALEFGPDQSIENPKWLFYEPLNKLVVLYNIIDSGGLFTYGNGLTMADDVDDLPTGVSYTFMGVGGLFGENAIGMGCPITAEGDALVWDQARGVVPFLYDEATWCTMESGFHLQRQINGSLLESVTHTLRFNDAGSNLVLSGGELAKPHTSFVGNIVGIFNNSTPSTRITFGYLQDGSGNGYELGMRNGQPLELSKVVAGVRTVIVSNNSASIFTDSNQIFVVEVDVDVTTGTHKARINGQLQILETGLNDFVSGVTFNLAGTAANADVLKLYLRKSNALTITGLEVAAPVTLLTTENDLPVATGVADDTGTVVLRAPTWPHDRIQIGAQKASLAGELLSGGDTVQVGITTVAGYSPETDASTVYWVKADRETFETQSFPAQITDWSPLGGNLIQPVVASRGQFIRPCRGTAYFLLDGDNDSWFNNAFAGLNGVGAYTAFIVCADRTNAPQNTISIATAGLQLAHQKFMGDVTSYIEGANFGSVPSPVKRPAIWAIRYDGSKVGNSNRLRMYIHGVQQTLSFTGTIPSSVNSTVGITLGAVHGGGAHWNGPIWEQFVVARSVSDDEFDAMYTYTKMSNMLKR